MAGPLNRPGQLSLMTGTEASLSAGPDLPPLAQKAAQGLRVLIVNLFHILSTKDAMAYTPLPPRLWSGLRSGSRLPSRCELLFICQSSPPLKH